jgi:hypothetical protein
MKVFLVQSAMKRPVAIFADEDAALDFRNRFFPKGEVFGSELLYGQQTLVTVEFPQWIYRKD